jgi:hypothetical protein
MGCGKLDTILIEEFITTPTTVNSEYVSDSIRITNREDAFSIQTVYDNGSNVNMRIVMEVSNDDINFSEVTDSQLTITDDTGSDIMDVGFTGVNFLRIKIEVTSGSIDLQRLFYSAKRRH